MPCCKLDKTAKMRAQYGQSFYCTGAVLPDDGGEKGLSVTDDEETGEYLASNKFIVK